MAHAQVPGQQQDAACTVTQQPSLASIKAEGTRFGTSEKQRKEAALAGPGEAPHYSPNQGGAKSASEPHATVTSGAASNAQVQPSLGDEASHTEAQAQQISLAEDCSDTFSESSADAAWDRGPQPQPPAAPNWRDLNQLLCHSGFSALPDAVRARTTFSHQPDDSAHNAASSAKCTAVAAAGAQETADVSLLPCAGQRR